MEDGSAKRYPPQQHYACLAASAALAVSDIPFHGPISEVRVARIDGKFVVNPTFSQNEKADMDIMVGATLDNVMMVEGEMDEVSEAEFLGAIKIAHAAIKDQCEAQIRLMEACNTVEKREYEHEDGRRAKERYLGQMLPKGLRSCNCSKP